MRKIDPAGVRANFAREGADIISHFDRLVTALAELATREGDLTRLAAQSFMALFVAFERFQSDIILAYLNRDFSRYQQTLALRIQAGIASKHGSTVASLVSIQTKAHVNVEELEGIIDPDGWNLTFVGVQKNEGTVPPMVGTESYGSHRQHKRR